MERFKLIMVGDFTGYNDNFACWHNVLKNCAGLCGRIPVVEYHLWNTKKDIQNNIIQQWTDVKIKSEVHWYSDTETNLHKTAFANYEVDPSFSILSSPHVSVEPEDSFYRHAVPLFENNFNDSIEVFDIFVNSTGQAVVNDDVKMSNTRTLARYYNNDDVVLTNRISKQSLGLN